MAKNPITILAEGNKLLNELEAKLTGVNTSLLEISKSARGANLKDYFNVKAPADVNEKLKLQKTIIEQLNAQVKERNRLEKALNNQLAKNKLAESDLAKELAKQRFETAERNKQIKASAILSSKLASEYQKLVVRMNQAGRARQNLVAKQAQGLKLSDKEQRELKQSSREFFKYEKAVKKADASINRYQRNVGNYSSALGKAGVAIRNLAGAFGVFSALTIAREIFELTKEIDGLDKALQQVTETQAGFNQAQSFIKGLADEAGVEINGLQRAYIKFFAASKTTNLTLEETQDIFRQTAKAGAVLGLSTDDINGSLRALEQILSKGKVQAEEIRGQLGERLPGAFQILAQSMGLTTAELSKQLELGNVLSDEVLPGFARQLEETYNLGLIEKVNTLTASQNRLSNAWNSVVRATTEGGAVTDSIISIFDGISTQINRVSEGIGVFNDGVVILKKGLDDFLTPLRELIAEVPFLNSLFQKQAKLLNNLAEAFTTPGITVFGNVLKLIGATLSGLGAGFRQAKKEALDFGNALAKLGDIDFSLNPLKTFKSAKAVFSDVLTDFKEGGKSVGDAFKKGYIDSLKSLNKEAEDSINDANKSLIQSILSKTDEYSKEQLQAKSKKELVEILKKLNSGTNENIVAIKGSIAFIELEIKALENKRKKLATNQAEYKKYTDAINDANASLNRLKDTLTGVSTELADAGLGEGIDLFTINDPTGLEDAEFKAFLDNEQRKRDAAQETAEIRREANEQVVENARDVFSQSIGLVNTLFDAKIQRYDDEINRNNDYYANLLDNERLSIEQRTALEAERDRKNAQLEKKKRTEQRKAAVLNKVAGLAEVAINTAIAVSKVTAQAGVAAPLLIPSIIALGALQAATIAATPIPQYKTGKKKGEGKDGIALLNDGGKDELKISKSGEIERITGRNVLSPVLKSDTIIPDADKFLSSLSDKELYENLHKYSIMSSIAHQTETINSLLIAQSIEKSNQKQTDRLIKAIESNRPKINLHNNNSIGDDLRFLAELSKL